MISKDNIQIINTISPRGDSSMYTINFSIQSEEFSSSGARVQIPSSVLLELKEGDKAQAVLDLIKKAVIGEPVDKE